MGKDRTIDLPVEENDDSTVQLPEEYQGGIGEESLEDEKNNHK